MMEETQNRPLANRDLYIAKRRVKNFVDYLCSGTITNELPIVHLNYIKDLSEFIISSRDERMFRDTFGSFNYERLQEVREETKSDLKTLYEMGVRGDYLKAVSSIMAFIGQIFYEKTILEEAGFTISDDSKAIKGAGRKKGNFRDSIIGKYKSQSDKIIKAIKEEIEGKKPKGIAIVLIAAINNGYIIQPELASFNREFNTKMDRNSYGKYLTQQKSPDLWKSEEVKRTQEALKSRII